MAQSTYMWKDGQLTSVNNSSVDKYKGMGYSADTGQVAKMHAQSSQPSYSQPSQSPYQSSYQGPDIAGMESKLNQAAEAQKASGLAAIKKQRETALQGYNQMETGTKTRAYDNRNQADAMAMQNAARIRQSMADIGLFNSGDNLTAQAQGNAQRQGAIGSINRDESGQLADIGERRTLLQNQAAEQETAFSQQIEADRLRQLIDLQRYGNDSSMNWDNMNYGRYRDTIGDQFNRDQLDWNKIIDTSNQTGYFNGNANWWNQVPAPQVAQSAPAPAPSTSGNPNTYYQNKLAEAERTGNKGLATWVRAQMKGGG